MTGYEKLVISALIPVVASALVYLLQRHTSFGQWKYTLQQAVVGVVFGGIAVIGTEWAIPVNGVLLNCRDAAPICAGLLFGGPAGIIAGMIGGLERWFAVYWGAGTITRFACTISTILAGFYSALVRRYMFDCKRPTWAMSLMVGTVIEVFHLTMVFVTNLADADRAASIVESCLAMIPFNAVSVMLATMSLSLLARESLRIHRGEVRITATIQKYLLITVVLAFTITTVFVYALQNGLAVKQSTNMLTREIVDLENEVQRYSDDHLLSLTHQIAERLESGEADLNALSKEFGVTEINIVDDNGIIVESTDADLLAYDMSSGEQSAEFLVLLNGQREYSQKYGPTSINPSISRKYAAVQYEDGFVQVGYSSVAFQSDISSLVRDITVNRHINESGYLLVADNLDHLVSAPADYPYQNLTALYLPKEDLTNTMVTFKATIQDVPCICMADTVENYTILAVLSEQEATQYRDLALYINAFLEVLVFAVLFALIYLLIKRIVLNNLHSINESLSQISGGDLSVVVNVRPNVEFASLSDDINSTVETLKHYISEAAARIDQELTFARNIQASALPSAFPAFPQCTEFDIHALMCTAKEVGGDFYDFYFTRNNILNFLIADVSGKGIPAAMFMMRAKTDLKSLAENGLSIDEIFTNGNHHLCDGNDADMFVTAWMGQLDVHTGEVSFANAGHNPPLVRRKDGSFAYLRSRAGLVLAGMDGMVYKRQTLQLEPGDVIFLYTDGVTEATDANNALYGEDRLLNLLNSASFTSMDELCHLVKEDVDRFVGEAPQFDDITMLALRFDGKPAAPEMHFEQASISDIPVITEFVEQELEKLDCPVRATIQLSVAIDEIYSNIVKFAYAGSSGPATVRLEPSADPRGVTLSFTDHGVPYNPMKKEDPDISLSAEDRQIGGLGIYMVKKSMDEMSYEYKQEQNILRLFKKF